MNNCSKMTGEELILGSASPRRLKLLTEAGLKVRVVVPDVEEDHSHEDPREVVLYNALLKHSWCLGRTPTPSRMVTADTVVVVDRAVIPKPESLAQAHEFLRRLSGRVHEVLTAAVYTGLRIGRRQDVVTSRVCFRVLDDDAIARYFARVNPLDKAGGYDIDQFPEQIVESYSGSLTNIVGLPMETVLAWLKEDGLL
jgi:septum formation protein